MDFAIVPDVPVTPETGTGMQAIVEQAVAAEKLGYTACFFPDHYIFEEIGALKPERPAYDPFVALTMVAANTERMKLVTHVVCMIFRHPAMSARLFAQLDEASNGRVVAGVGAGWTRAEFEIMGIEFPEVSERLKIMDETIEIMKGLWNEETYSFEGKYFKIADAPCLPKPIQAGGPPIMLGGSGKGILRRAGRWGDILHIVPQTGKAGTTTPEEIKKLTDDGLAERLKLVREEEEKAGREPGSVKFATTIFNLVITESPKQSSETIEAVSGLFGMDVPTVRAHPSLLIGTPDEMVEELERRRERHGMELVGVHPGTQEQLERFGQEVLPKIG